MIFSKPQGILKKNDGAEFRKVILDVETVLVALDYRVASAHRDVIDPHFTLVPSSKFKFRLLVSHCEHMDVSRSVLVERHRLEQDVLAAWLRFVDVDQFEQSLALLEYVGIGLLADFAFEFLPVVTSDVFTVLLDMSLSL